TGRRIRYRRRQSQTIEGQAFTESDDARAMFDRRMLLECRDFAAGWVPITPTWPVNYLISLVFTGIYGWLRGWESNPCRLLKTKNFTDLGFLTNRLIRSKGGVETRIEHAACDEGRARIAIQIV